MRAKGRAHRAEGGGRHKQQQSPGARGGSHWPEEPRLSLGINISVIPIDTQPQGPAAARLGEPDRHGGSKCRTARAEARVGGQNCVHEGVGLSDGGGGKKVGRL